MKKYLILLLIVSGLLAIPFIATKISDEVNWSFSDFLIMGLVLYMLGSSYLLIDLKTDQTSYKVAIAVGLLGAFLLFWVNAAVGIIGSENQSANSLFGVVFLVGFTGSILSRFRSRGMYLTMTATSITQALVPVCAYFIWPPGIISWSPGVIQVYFLNTGFVLLFAFSALLFKKSSLTIS
jgi:uncharacterized membrane protein